MKRIFITLIFLLLIAGGAFFYTKSTYVVHVLPEVQQPILEDKSLYEKQKAELQRKQIDDTNFYNGAIESQDIHICESISNQEKKSECMDMIHSTVAQKQLNPELCLKLSSSGAVISCKDNTLSSLAQKDKKKTPCLSISDESLQKYCKETIDTLLFKEKTDANALTLEFCNALESPTSESCRTLLKQKDSTALYQDALSSHKLVDCDVIPDQNLASTCRDALLLEQALKWGDINLCNQITELPKKQFCITQIGKRGLNVDFSTLVASGDVTNCQKLSTERLKNQCHDMILISQVRTSKDTNLCSSLSNTGMLNTCIQGAQ